MAYSSLSAWNRTQAVETVHQIQRLQCLIDASLNNIDNKPDIDSIEVFLSLYQEQTKELLRSLQEYLQGD